MPYQNIECIPFATTEFEDLVARLCRGSADCDQVKYLAAYLNSGSLSVKTLVIERDYVDRHFIEEYSSYYATCFRPPESHTIRIHAFALELSRDQLFGWVREAASGEQSRNTIESVLQLAYRGFVVIRPLASAPVGRTLLSTFTDVPARCFETLQRSNAHLLGFELAVESVPFQQQDGAVGACATTAAWSALSTVARATGHRGPTPFQVTSAATRHVLNDRQLPAHGGLDQQQVLSAIREFGFEPYVLKASNEFATFSHSLKCYLASGIPVVLLVEAKEPDQHSITTISGYHALTAVGFRSPDREMTAGDFVLETGKSWSLVTSGFSRVYVHEDRLGAYARMKWLSPAADGDTPRLQHLPFSGSRYSYDNSPMNVYSGIVPLYPKLRLTAREMLEIAADVMPFMRMQMPETRESLRVDLRFKLGGAYLRELLALGVEDAEALAHFVTKIVLPRYVGVIRFSAGGLAIGDVVCDTTDMLREQKFDSILGVVPFVSNHVDAFREFTTKYLSRR